MIFEDKLVALLKNPGYTISQGYRLYEVDPFGLMYSTKRCISSDDPSNYPGDCSSDSKRSLDNQSFYNVGSESFDDGLFNFANASTETLVDVYIDQPNDCLIFIQTNSASNSTKVYLSRYKQVERRTVTDTLLPEYFLIGEITGFQATRTARFNNKIYAVNGNPGSQQVYEIELNIENTSNYLGSSISSSLITTYTDPDVIKDITWDSNRSQVVALTSTDLLIYNGSWTVHPIANNTGYTREHQSITYDYLNDLYIIGNLSGVGSSYGFRGPTRSVAYPDNILNDAAIFTLIKGNNLSEATDVPYFTVDNIEDYRYPLIFLIDNLNNTPTLPYKTYCNITKVRFFEMNGMPRIVGRDDFIYQVPYDYLTGKTLSEESYIHRSLVTYSSYSTNVSSNSEIIQGVLSVIATTDKENAVSTDPNQIPQWISFDYAPYTDIECSKVLINSIKICHDRAAKCVGSDSLVLNGEFLDGLSNWIDLDNNIFPNPYDPTIWSEAESSVNLGSIVGLKQFINSNGLVELRFKINDIEPAIDSSAGVVIKFYNSTNSIEYQEEITAEDLGGVSGIYATELAVEAQAFSIEMNNRATNVVIDYVLICDIAGEKSCKPGFDKISYDSFIDSNGEWTKSSDPNVVCGFGAADNPYHNQRNRFDVNADGRVNQTDVDQLVNFLQRAGGSVPLPLAPGVVAPRYPDVNNDGFVNSTDALGIINYLRAQGSGSSAPPSTINLPFYFVERAFIPSTESNLQCNNKIINTLKSLDFSVSVTNPIIKNQQFGLSTLVGPNFPQVQFQCPPPAGVDGDVPIDGRYDAVYSLVGLHSNPSVIEGEPNFIGVTSTSLKFFKYQEPKTYVSKITGNDIYSFSTTSTECFLYNNDPIILLGQNSLYSEGDRIMYPSAGNYWNGTLKVQRYNGLGYDGLKYSKQVVGGIETPIGRVQSVFVPKAIKHQEKDNSLTILYSAKFAYELPTYSYLVKSNLDFIVNGQQDAKVIYDFTDLKLNLVDIDELHLGDNNYIVACGGRTEHLLYIVEHDGKRSTKPLYYIQREGIKGDVYEVNLFVAQSQVFALVATRFTNGITDQTDLFLPSVEEAGFQNINCVQTRSGKCRPIDFAEAMPRLAYGASEIYLINLTNNSKTKIYQTNNCIVELAVDKNRKFA